MLNRTRVRLAELRSVRTSCWSSLPPLGPAARRPSARRSSLLIQTEDVDPCPVRVARPLLPRVQRDEVAFFQRAHEVNALARVVPGHALEVRDEPLLAVGHDRIVLGICGADVFLDCLARSALVEHQRVELFHGTFVPLQLAGHAAYTCTGRTGRLLSLRKRRTSVSTSWARRFSSS